MKSLVTLALVLLSTNVFSSDVLLKLNRHSGFSPVPFSSVLSIRETGKVDLLTTRGTVSKKTKLETLSPNTIQEIKDNIEKLNAKDALVDLDANKPRCMDAPSQVYTAIKDGKEIEIGRNFSCHRVVMKSKAAAALVKTIQEIDSKR